MLQLLDIAVELHQHLLGCRRSQVLILWVRLLVLHAEANLHFNCMDLFLQIINLLKQDHIFFHVLGILLLMLILVGGNLGAAILDHALQVLSLLRLVALALLVVDLLM